MHRMEKDFVEKEPKMKRMTQVYCVGGNYHQPSDFTKAVNRNIKILMDGDRNCEIVDVDFNIHNHPRYIEHGLLYLAFIVAEVDIVDKPASTENFGKKKRRKKK